MVFVHQGDVVKNILLLDQHLTHALVDDDREFARKGWVPGLAIGDGGGHHMAGAVLVLQTLPAQGGAPRGGPQQKTPGALVGGGPNLVTHALKTKHRVINIEGQHGQTMHAVAGGRCRPTGQGTGFGDALFQNLTVHRFAVTEHRANVLGRIFLAHAGINAHLLEQIGHAKGACLVGHDGHHAGPQVGIFEQSPQQAHKGHGGAHFFAARLGGKTGVVGECGHRYHRTGGHTPGQIAAQALAALVHVAHLRAVSLGL